MRHFLLATLLLAVGCEADPCAGGAACVTPEVEPTSARVPLLGQVRIKATAPVTWSLLEGSGAGAIAADGTYTAPFARGTFHVVASRDGVEVARVPVTVGPTQLEVAVGSPGSIRRVDGRGTEARLGTIAGWAGDGQGNAWFSEKLYPKYWIFAGAAIRRFEAATGSVSTLATFDEPVPTCLAEVGDAVWVAREADLWKVDRATGAARLLLANPFGDGAQPLSIVAEPGAVYVQSAKKIVEVDPITLATTLVMDATEFIASLQTVIGRHPTTGGFIEMTRIGPGRLAVFSVFVSPLGNTTIRNGSVAVLDVASRKVADVYDIDSARMDAARGLVARAQPQPDDPEAFEWQLTTGFPRTTPDFVYSLIGWPAKSSWSINRGVLGPCSPSDPTVCNIGFTLLGDPLGQVTGLAYHPDGLMAADNDHHAIQLLDPRPRPGVLVVSALAGAYGGVPANGPLLAARFDTPRALAAVDDHTLLAVDLTDQQGVRVVDLSDGEVRTAFHDAFTGDVSGPPDPWIVAGIAVRDGHVFASLPKGHIVYELDPTQSPWRRVGLFGYSGEATTVDGPQGTARFESPRGLAADPAGNLYVADSASGRVRKIDRANQTSTIASGLASPVAVAWAGDNLLVIAEPGRLLRLDVGSGALSTISDSGWQGISAIGHHAAGVLYVADAGARRVRAVQVATGATLDLAGDPSREVVIAGSLPGALADPAGIAVLPSGDVYVTDSLDHALMRIR